MRILILATILTVTAENAFAQVMPKIGEHNYKGTDYVGVCIDKVEYLRTCEFCNNKVMVPRLKPDGKPQHCNY